MAGLVLKLAPNERVLINGAVLENDVRRSRFSIITPSANVLRLKDAIHPKNATTPISRLCYQLQLILAGSCDYSDIAHQIETQIFELSQVFQDGYCQEQLASAQNALSENRFYSALKAIRLMLPIEGQLLSKARSLRS